MPRKRPPITPGQQSFFPEEFEPPQPERMKKSLDKPTPKPNDHDQEIVVEGIPQLKLPNRWEHLNKDLLDSVTIKTIIRPVRNALQLIRNITEYLETTGGCQVLVIRADTGSGKTTFLNTLPHYMPDVNLKIQSIDLQFLKEDEFVNELGNIKLTDKGINLVILEGREKPGAITDQYIQVVLANINRFSRTRKLPMLFVIPTIEEQVARAWCDHGVKIGDLIPETKLYDGSRWYTFPGVPKNEFVNITKDTVRVLNGRNLEDFGVSQDELEKWAENSNTIGRFIEIVAKEATNRRAKSRITIEGGKKEHVWVLFCGPDWKHYDHTYLVVDGLVHDEKLHASPTKLLPPDNVTSMAKFWRSSPQWGKLVTTLNFLDIRLINFSITSAVSAFLAYGEQELLEMFKAQKFRDFLDQLPEEMKQNPKELTADRLIDRRLQAQNARASLEKSNLFYLLKDMPAIPTKGFRPEEPRTLAQYLFMMDKVNTQEIHRCIATALDELLRYHQFPGYVGTEYETPIVHGQTDPRPDVTIHTTTDIYGLEFHFFSKQFTSSEMSRYLLERVADKYMKGLPHLSSQLHEAYGDPI